MFTKHIGILNKFAPLLARIFIGGMFLASGISKITGFTGTVEFIQSAGFPVASLLAIGAIVVEIAAGLSLLVGYKIRWGATLLVIYTLAATFMFHADFSNQIQVLFFTKNFAIIGGLLYMAVHGAGAFSHESMELRKSQFTPPTTE